VFACSSWGPRVPRADVSRRPARLRTARPHVLDYHRRPGTARPPPRLPAARRTAPIEVAIGPGAAPGMFKAELVASRAGEASAAVELDGRRRLCHHAIIPGPRGRQRSPARPAARPGSLPCRDASAGRDRRRSRPRRAGPPAMRTPRSPPPAPQPRRSSPRYRRSHPEGGASRSTLYPALDLERDAATSQAAGGVPVTAPRVREPGIGGQQPGPGERAAAGRTRP